MISDCKKVQHSAKAVKRQYNGSLVAANNTSSSRLTCTKVLYFNAKVAVHKETLILRILLQL